MGGLEVPYRGIKTTYTMKWYETNDVCVFRHTSSHKLTDVHMFLTPLRVFIYFVVFS